MKRIHQIFLCSILSFFACESWAGELREPTNNEIEFLESIKLPENKADELLGPTFFDCNLICWRKIQ